MAAEQAPADDGGGVFAAEICPAEGRGAVVPRGRGNAVEGDLPLAGGEAWRCAGACDCARAGGVLRFELCTGDCGQGMGAGFPCDTDEPAELRRDGAADAYLV